MATEIEVDALIKEEEEFGARWGLSADETYRIAQQFYKEKNGSKAMTLSYNDRLKLLALTKQVTNGKYDPALLPDNGLFDVVGNHRRQVWQALGDMSKKKAMMEFTKTIDSLCPLFGAVVEAHKIEKEEEERKKRAEVEELERIAKTKQEEELKKQQEILQKQRAQEMLIRNALNQQTYNQFRSYAELQHPKDLQQQEALIIQLQEQHYLQYMQQVYSQQQQQQQFQQQNFNVTHVQQLSRSSSAHENSTTSPSLSLTVLPSNGIIPTSANILSPNGLPESDRKPIAPAEHRSCEEKHSHNSNQNHLNAVETASLWTRKDMASFKESLKGEHDAVINVGSGELVTIRVPTHQNGTSLFWEFATDSLDIGFGLSFEWENPSAHEGEENRDTNASPTKAEGSSIPEKKVEVIVPIVRRQSHVEVQCGSHLYPGSGVYLLMFDNSYSLWRSKSVYYRVFYSQ